MKISVKRNIQVLTVILLGFIFGVLFANGSSDGFMDFTGGVIGGVIGGILTYGSVFLTLQDQNKKEYENSIPQKLLSLDKMMICIKNKTGKIVSGGGQAKVPLDNEGMEVHIKNLQICTDEMEQMLKENAVTLGAEIYKGVNEFYFAYHEHMGEMFRMLEYCVQEDELKIVNYIGNEPWIQNDLKKQLNEYKNMRKNISNVLMHHMLRKLNSNMSRETGNLYHILVVHKMEYEKILKNIDIKRFEMQI